MVKVPCWMVDDDQVVLAAVGEVMHGIGVRATDARLVITDLGPSTEMATAQPTGEMVPSYRFTGRITSARAFEVEVSPCRPERWAEMTIELADCRLVVDSFSALEHFPVGDFVTLESRLETVAEYEWDDFEIPDVRADWRVLSVTPMWNAALKDSDYLVDLVPTDCSG